MTEESLIQRFMRYVRISSESGEEDMMCQTLLAELKELGLDPHVDKAGEAFGSTAGNIVCRIPGRISGEWLLLVAHMDTVKPGKNVTPSIKDGYIVSDGTTVLGGDDKSGIAIIMEAVTHILHSGVPHRPVELLFTVGEELGLKGSAALDYQKLRSKEAIVLDSQGTVGDIKVYAPGKNKLHIAIHGRAAHAGACPEDGVDAIYAAACGVSKMRLLRIDDETTANIGSFIAEGATNVVNNLVHIEAEVRSQSIEKLDAQCAHMIRCIEDAAEENNATAECVVEASTKPYRIRQDHPLILEIDKLCRRFDLPTRVFGDGGGSDANNLIQHNITAIALGCGMDKVHTIKETLCIREFYNAAQVIEKLLTVARAT